jgi:glutamine synthetase
MQGGKNLYAGWEGGQGGLADQFLAGVLAHLPALQAFTVPTPIGYERMKPGVLVSLLCESTVPVSALSVHCPIVGV